MKNLDFSVNTDIPCFPYCLSELTYDTFIPGTTTMCAAPTQMPTMPPPPSSIETLKEPIVTTFIVGNLVFIGYIAINYIK